MNELVSLIVPVYNVEKYIRECFDSVRKQEYQNFEVIAIDDGSTDNSGRICDEYVGMDSRFHVIHTENRGIGAARNLAMEKMAGRYCFFLDPDDVLETDSLSYLVHLIEHHDAEIAMGVTRQFAGDYQEVGEEKPVEKVYHGHTSICEEVLFDKNDLKPFDKKREPSKVTYEFFSCLYLVPKLREKNIRFLPISYGEDTYVCFKYLLLSQTVVTSTKITYSHRRNPTSTTFQYHPNYLEETKKYYQFYLELFELYAPEYLERATVGLDAQYLRRCLSGMERELFFSPQETAVSEKINVIRLMRRDAKFKELFKLSNFVYMQNGVMRIILLCIKLGIYPPVVATVDARNKRRK